MTLSQFAKKVNNTQKGIKTDGFQNREFWGLPKFEIWCISNFGTRLGGSLAPKRVSKPMVFQMASSGDFQNLQLWCTSNFGTRLGVSEKGLHEFTPQMFGPKLGLETSDSPKKWRRFRLATSMRGHRHVRATGEGFPKNLLSKFKDQLRLFFEITSHG